jgi:non-specific serine/threonine protein kinase
VALEAGVRLHNYEVLAPLGAGGMGEVYLARDTRLDRPVALKLLPSRLSHDPVAIANFRREALTLAALNHPNIAIIHGLEELEGGAMALIMERVEGETLATRLARSRMRVEEALQICAQVAVALEVAHEHGIVHRDVKPGNVMIGRRGLVKVLDFGLAQRTRRLDRIAALASEAPPHVADDMAPTIAMETPVSVTPSADPDSSEGVILGTPGYMSPEQILAQPADARSDVFAVGVVLYECVAGRPAFAGSGLAAMHATLNAPVAWADLPDQVPAPVRALMASCVEKDPEARPADMRTVRVALEEALGVRRASALRDGAVYATPNNLPPRTTSFVGREEVLRDCGRLMEEARLITLLGMGGSGKTRVAQRLAELALDRSPDGVWFVDLAPVTADEHVVEVATTALGVQDEPGKSAIEALVHHVRDHRVLFVVDNCEHVLPGARILVEALLSGCAGARVVATSREPLEARGEIVYSLPTLATPGAGVADLGALMAVESVRLFVDRARATQPEFTLTRAEANDVVEICRRLDGIPLALELAAARVRMLGVGQIRARLGDRFKLLARSGNGSSRQQTVLATIRWSWDHLLPPEQDLMRRLAVFRAGWTLERAAAVVSDSGDEFEVLDLLTRLVERSLVVVERPVATAARYRFLETVHQFALEKLEAHPDHALVCERHLEAYLKLGKAAREALVGPNVLQQMVELKPEQENLIAALAWCDHAADGARHGLQLAESLSGFWTRLGRFALGRRLLEEAIRRDAGNPPNALRAWTLTRAAGGAVYMGDHETARRELEESLAFWRSSGDPSGLPAALAGLGVVAMYQKRYEDAHQLAMESLAIYRARGQTRGVAMVLHNLGTIEAVLEHPDHGRAHFEQALAMFRQIGDRTTETLCLSALSVARLRVGDAPSARTAMRECFAALAEIEGSRESVFALEALVELLGAENRPIDAARFKGAIEAARAALGLSRLPNEQEEMERVVSRIEIMIGADAFARAEAEGLSLPLAAAVAEGAKAAASLGATVRPQQGGGSNG